MLSVPTSGRGQIARAAVAVSVGTSKSRGNERRWATDRVRSCVLSINPSSGWLGNRVDRGVRNTLLRRAVMLTVRQEARSPTNRATSRSLQNTDRLSKES